MSLSSPTTRAVIAGVLAIVFWASAFPAIRVTLRVYSPGELAAFRFLIASAFFAIYQLVRRQRLPKGKDLLRVIVAGASGITAYNLLLNTGELTVDAGVASMIVNCMPVFAALLSVLFLHERLRPIGWLGIAVSFCGVSVIALRDPQGVHFGLGAAYIFLAALSSALMGFIQKPLLRSYTSSAITACIMWSGAFFLVPFLPGALKVAAHAPLSSTMAIVFLGIFPAAIGYLTWAIALSRFTLSQTAGMLYLIPIVAVLISFLWIGEKPAPSSWMGGAMAIFGVILLNRYGRRPVTT